VVGSLSGEVIPESDWFVRENCPIRDIASVWDAEVLGDFLGREELRSLIEKSLRHYEDYLVERDGWLLLDPRPLGEPSSIAHSAFMMLALLHAPLPRLTRQIAALAEGIVCQQRADGSYKVYFHDLPDHGEELYAGEAMLALLEAYRQLEDLRFLQSAERGFRYYDAHYFRPGRVGDDLLVFFANWQSQRAVSCSNTLRAPSSSRTWRTTFSKCTTGSSPRAFSATSSVTRRGRCRWRSPAPWRGSMTPMRSDAPWVTSAPKLTPGASARG
jgi:hypothetical protein